MLTLQCDQAIFCLRQIANHFNVTTSAESMLAGLPIHQPFVSSDLFVRIAEKAGFVAEFFESDVEEIHEFLLPCILQLKNGDLVVLKSKNEKEVIIAYPSNTDGDQLISLSSVKKEFSGAGYFLKKEMSFDSRAPESLNINKKHWFWNSLSQSFTIYRDVLLASILINIFAITTPIFTMNVYDRVVPNLAFDSLWVLAIGAIIVFTFDFILRQLRSYFIDLAGKKSDIIISSKIFEKILTVKMNQKPVSTGAFARHIQEFESIREFLTSATVATLIDLPFACFFLVVIGVFSGWLVFVPVIAIILVAMYGVFIQRPLAREIENSNRLSTQKYATIIESLIGIETIKTQNAEGIYQQRWEESVGHIADSNIRIRSLTNSVSGFSSYIQQLTTVFILVLGVYQLADSNLSLGALIAAVMLSSRAISPLIQITVLFTRYNQTKSAFFLINDLMNRQSEYKTEESNNYIHYPIFNGDIEFRNVSFKYDEQSENCLKNVTFKIKKGEKVALIGKIGSGKSTLQKMLVNLYQPVDGFILIDEINLNQIHPSTIRKNISCLHQDFSIFYGSIKENIKMGSLFCNDKKIVEAANKAGVSFFTNHNENGLDKILNENGKNISGGQRQAIALARVFLANSPIMILDEPTANMDNRSEIHVKNSLKALDEDQTLIIITHRFSMLDVVDRIIVLNDGVVVADGEKQFVLEELNQGRVRVNL